MYNRFLQHIEKEHLIVSGQRVLLAVSGGRDSVVLCHLVNRAGIPFGIAHCNFHLRPGDCDSDEQFVRRLAESYGVPCYVAQFNTESYAEKNGLSIEEAARRQRYSFFEEIRAENGYHLVATAHHRDDAIETFFINLTRGTGLQGLCGIPARNGYVVRPLLPFGRDEIDGYVASNGLDYVDDVTNFQPLYLRNRIRLQLLPLIRQISPSFDEVMASNLNHLTDAQTIYNSVVEQARGRLLRGSDEGYSIPISELRELEPLSTYLFEFLRPFGFSSSVVLQIVDSLDAQSGKQFFSSTHRLVKDRGSLIIQPLSKGESAVFSEQYSIPKSSFTTTADVRQSLGDQSSVLHFSLLETIPVTLSTHSSEALFDFDKLAFPLCLRRWRHGDRFRPFGMRGSRLVSDLFSDLKFSLLQKENAWLLCDAEGEILWIVGVRASSHAIVDKSTSKILKCSVKDK